MSLPWSLFACWSIILSLLSKRIGATSTNRTIDDYYGDSVTGLLPVYSDNWNYGPTCSVCEAQPAANLTFDASWHDANSNSPSNSTVHTITLSFTGTAIWVYGIMLNSFPSPTVTLTNVSFTLDGAASGRFVHVPHPKTEELEYNVTIYNKTELENAEHTLVMTVMQDPNPSVLLFDWAMYTFLNDSNVADSNTTSDSDHWSHGSHHGSGYHDSSRDRDQGKSDTSTTSHVSKGAIAGGVIGGVSALVLLGGAVFWWYRRRRRRAIRVGGRDIEKSTTRIEPFLGKPVIDPTPAPSTMGGAPTTPSTPDAEPFSEKTLPTSPAPVYNGEVIDIRADRVEKPKPVAVHGELIDQVDDLKRQVASLRSAMSAGVSDTVQSSITLLRPPKVAPPSRRRGIASYEKLHEQPDSERLRGRRGSQRDTVGTEPPPAYD